MDLAVYISTDAGLAIAPGSGIVGAPPDSSGQLLIDYEGNLYASTNLVRYASRVMQAAGRHIARYPTVARSLVPVEAVAQIGWWDTERRALRVDDMAALGAWLGVSSVDPQELMPQSAWHSQRAEIRAALARSPSPAELVTIAQWAHRHGHGDLLPPGLRRMPGSAGEDL